MNSHLKNIVLFAIFFQANQSVAVVEYTYNSSFRGYVDISGPADKTQFMKLLANTGSSFASLCSKNNEKYTLARIEYQPLAKWTGISYQINSAFALEYLFETGVSGFSVTPLGGLTTEANSYKPLPSERAIIWKGRLDNDNRVKNPVWVNMGFYLYKGADRFTTSQLLPGQKVYRYECYDDVGNLQEIVNVEYSSFPIHLTVASCVPTNNVVSVELEKLPASAIEKADSSENIGLKQQSFSLQCDPNINVYTSIVDLSDISNQSTVSNLTADSSASGIGFAVIGPSGQRLKFGSDGSAQNIPGQIKYLLGRSGTSEKNNPINFNLGFSYVRKPEVEFKTGTAKAIIGITYSYQ
ncbi:fimbrial protein (plasmid) [Providencia rettgeri]|uniref:fimbrial protein n=1 Tax=Providencia rettgeri TaxID=587 RepID=UPI001CA672C9|nr:fimbrial protein [Providencia rettgeri]